MITPGLLRRSFARASSWRLLLFQLLLLLPPALVALHPPMHELGAVMGHWPRASQLTSRLDSSGLFDLLSSLMAPGRSDAGPSMISGLLLALLAGPLFAGAVLASERSDERPRLRELFTGAASHYGRLLRLLLSGAIPYALLGGLGALAFKWAGKVAERSISESAADRATLFATLLSMLLLLFAQLWLDAGRAQFAAQPSRRSGFLALCSGGWLLLRRPLRSLWLGLSTALLSLLLAGALLVVRQQVEQSTALRVGLALLLAQLAAAALGWGRAARLFAFAELVRSDAALRARRDELFAMAPPPSSPPPSSAAAAPADDHSRAASTNPPEEQP